MARELSEINQELDNNINDVFDAPSVSKVAEWQSWKSIWAMSVWAFEKILDAFKSDIELKISQKQPGTLSWYYDQVMSFQGADDGNGFQGDDLIMDESGILRYELEDSARKIIAQSSLTDIEDRLAIKVAKLKVENEFEPLTAIELNAFTVYMKNIKYPGTDLLITSLQPDLIKYDLNIYYDPVFSEDTITTNVLAKMEEFKDTLGFDDKFFKQKFVDYLLYAEGVVSVKLNDLSRKASADPDFITIDVVYELAAGYFNYQAADAATSPSILNLINVNILYV